MSDDSAAENRGRLKELALLFLRLGFTAFGGPSAHIVMMEHEVVVRRKWVDRRHFLDLVAAVNFVPGPNSTELAIHLGFIRAGFAGLAVAGVCFITPAVLIILPLAWMYVQWGALPQAAHVLSAINAAIVAIIGAALWRFSKSSVVDSFTGVVAAITVVFALVMSRFPQYQPDLIALGAAAVAGAIHYARPKALHVTPLLIPLLNVDSRNLMRAALLFLKIGATLFGSGYVLVSYLQHNFVDQTDWLTRQELLDSIAVGQVTPGPLLTTATFIGYVLGQRFLGTTLGAVVGAIACTVAIFSPSFLFIALLGRVLPRIRANRYARGALNAVNAAVMALIFVVVLRLGQSSLAPNGQMRVLNVLIAAVSFALLAVWDVNSTWLVIGAGLVGAVAR
ncbi:MAG TPA: chromate efflux transporter [Tepidisphaeraceae bacterium]|jgi:chromate transporter